LHIDSSWIQQGILGYFLLEITYHTLGGQSLLKGKFKPSAGAQFESQGHLEQERCQNYLPKPAQKNNWAFPENRPATSWKRWTASLFRQVVC
jgi:hypothetical protein